MQEVKNTSTIIMDRVKAPNCLWYHCLKYVVVLLNHLSSKGLDHKTPIEKAFGEYTCAQLYVGKESTFTEIYGMKTKNQMPDTLQDFIRQWRAPSELMSNSVQVKTFKQIKEILRMYAIKDMQSEPNHQHQNYAERRI